MTHIFKSSTLLFGALLFLLPIQTKAQSKGSFKSLWEEVEQFKKDGKTSSALDKTIEIKSKAEKEKKEDERIKAIIHVMYFQGLKEEDSFIKSLNDLEAEIQKSQEPARSILHSAIAEMYQWYYENNRWKLLARAKTDDDIKEDITTWGAERLILKIDEHYSASLSKADFLKKTPPADFDLIWDKGEDGRMYQPSLFDVLTRRALDFYEQSNSGITLPRDQFNIDDSKYFSEATAFVQLENKKVDYLSFDLKVIELYQSLMLFHLAQKNTDALAYNDLSRLNFVYKRYQHTDKDALYKDGLNRIIQTYSTNDISADAIYKLAELHYNMGKLYDPFENPSAQWDIKKSVDLCDKAIKARPNSLGADRCKALKANVTQGSIQINMESIVYPDEDFLMSLYYKNVKKIYFRIVSLKEQILVKEADKNINQNIQYFLEKKAIKEWSTALIDSGDFQFHRLELPIDKIKTGYYALISSTDPSFKTADNLLTSNTFWVSSLAYFYAQEQDGSAKLFVTDRKSGLPEKGVKANIYLQTYNYEKRGNELTQYDVKSSDASGKILIQGQAKNNGFKVLLSKGKDSLMINNIVHVRTKMEQEERSFYRTSIFTDRAVYRPGQNVYFKGILMQSKGFEVEVVQDKKLSIKLFDANNQEVSRMELNSNEFGSFHGSFTLPSSALTGRFYLDDGSSRHTIQVEEYKRPSFEISSEEIEENYKLGDAISISGTAISLNGVPLSNAKGTYHITRNWANITPYYYYRNVRHSNETEISQGNFIVDEKGRFEFTFEAVPDKNVAQSDRPIFTYQIELMITDVNGESQQQKRSVKVGYHSMEVGMDGRGEMSKESLAETVIWTKNLMGVFTPSEVKVEVYKLEEPSTLKRARLWDIPDYHLLSKAEFNKQFPKDDYSNESDMLDWKLGEKALEDSFITQKGKSFFKEHLQVFENGAYEIRLSSKDPFGQLVDWSGRTIVYDLSTSTMPVLSNLWTKVSDNKTHVGEALTIFIGSSVKKGKVLYNIRNKDGLILEAWMDLKGGLQTINYTVNEADRGQLAIQIMLIAGGRIYLDKHLVQVPLEHKALSLKLETIRKDLKPGDMETWKLSVLDNEKKPVEAEILASMYDASLDFIRSNPWWFNPYSWRTTHIFWYTGNNFQPSNSQYYPYFNREVIDIRERKFDRLNWFGFYYQGSRMYDMRSFAQALDGEKVASADEQSANTKVVEEVLVIEETEAEEKQESKDRIRTDFRETAFFFPNLISDVKGGAEFSFQVPDALTKWKLQVLAHTPSLQYGVLKDEFVTKKELMVLSNYPRFLTEGDTIIFSAKISNLLDEQIEAKTRITVSNPSSGVPIKGALLSKKEKTIRIEAGQSEVVQWKLYGPEKTGLMEISVFAESENHTDGESKTLPVLSKSILVTETYPIAVRGGAEKKVVVKSLEKAQSSLGIKPNRLTLEVTSNPSWYVVQALPYLAEIGNESTEQLFNRYYANRLAFYITESNEQIQKVFQLWKESSPESFLSKLEQNAELKNIVLSETPWLLEAKDEGENKKKIALFFDQNNIRNSLNTALFELMQSQSPNGGWPWFKGMEDNRFVTQHIVMGLGRIDHLISQKNPEKSLKNEGDIWNRIAKAIAYMDARMEEEYRRIISSSGKKENTYVSAHQIQYLFARSYFQDIPVAEKHLEAFDYFKDQNRKYWLKSTKYLQAMTALAFHRFGEVDFAKKILTSLRENAIQSDEFGMYWKKEAGYAWYQANVEQQAMIIEAFREIENDRDAVEEMKIYLLKNKQTHRWRTGKATAEACYALLMSGDDLLSSSNKLNARVGKEAFEFPISGRSEAGTSYTKLNWSGPEIKAEMKDVSLKNKGGSVAWGAVYFQYFQSSDAVEASSTGLSISRELYVKRYNNEGIILKKIDESVHLETGEVLVVKMIVKSDRDLEFVHLKDMKAAGLEPFDAISGYRYKDGIGYYLSIRDAATHFYFNRLTRGTHILEYELKANNSGSYSTGISTIQSFYAPEFSAHSKGGRIEIE